MSESPESRASVERQAAMVSLLSGKMTDALEYLLNHPAEDEVHISVTDHARDRQLDIPVRRNEEAEAIDRQLWNAGESDYLHHAVHRILQQLDEHGLDLGNDLEVLGPEDAPEHQAAA